MAEQSAGVAVGDRDRGLTEQVPPPSRGAHDRSRDEADRPARRSRGRRPPGAGAARGRGWPATVLLIGLPLLGAGVDEAFGPGVGLLFAVCAVLGCAGAAALVGRAGWWWVVPAGPPVVLAATAVAELLANAGKYRDARSVATGAARWTITGFPVMVVALGAALAVVLVRIGRGRGHHHG
ncbi:hypothetical protein GCM10009760_00590 [Kitasatospora kazusensis]|uniref:DUF6542 domain-containing protein n=1 Tax=Kitasatospora kazusensis TaxID=407974 RepID=A0ABP5KAN5_9ACTN